MLPITESLHFPEGLVVHRLPHRFIQRAFQRSLLHLAQPVIVTETKFLSLGFVNSFRRNKYVIQLFKYAQMISSHLEFKELLSREIFLSRTSGISCAQNRRSSGVDVYGAATSLIYNRRREITAGVRSIIPSAHREKTQRSIVM